MQQHHPLLQSLPLRQLLCLHLQSIPHHPAQLRQQRRKGLFLLQLLSVLPPKMEAPVRKRVRQLVKRYPFEPLDVRDRRWSANRLRLSAQSRARRTCPREAAISIFQPTEPEHSSKSRTSSQRTTLPDYKEEAGRRAAWIQLHSAWVYWKCVRSERDQSSHLFLP